MIEAKWLRGEEEREMLRRSEEARGSSSERRVELARLADAEWRSAQHAAEQAARSLKEAKRGRREHAGLKEEERRLRQRAARAAEQRQLALAALGNVVHASVLEDAGQQGECAWKRKSPAREGVMWKEGSSVAGGGEYFLLGDAALTHQLLSTRAMLFLRRLGYTPALPPLWMSPSSAALVAHQPCAELQYSVGAAHSPLLVASSEQPMLAMHQGRVFSPSHLPLRYGALSSCWRRESQARGEGLFRVPRFEKVEQLILCEPHEGWRELELSVQVALDFFASLGLRCRVVRCSARDMSRSQSLKYDILAWFGDEEAWREVASCACMTDYYSRALRMRYKGTQSVHNEGYVWCVASTLCAVQRTMECLYANSIQIV